MEAPTTSGSSGLKVMKFSWLMTVNVQSAGRVCSSNCAVFMPAKPPPTMTRFLYMDRCSSRRRVLVGNQARVSVGISDDHAGVKSERPVVRSRRIGREKPRTSGPQLPRCSVRLARAQVDLPVPEVIRCRVRRGGAAGPRCEILEELDSRTLCGAQRGDAQVRAEHIVEMLLLGAVILARSGDMQSE